MANKFGADILIQAQEPMKAARFYVEYLGFEITDNKPTMIGLHGDRSIYLSNLVRRWGRCWKSLRTTSRRRWARLVKNGCEVNQR